ncbi:MAG: helix-turn-helix domain-containing protein [Armatimonadota bacterium]|nr:helix-turn-helix domain-containing protein [Armatimonadota bacterium]
MRNVQDWNKYVDMLGKAVTKKVTAPAPVSHENGVKAREEARNGSGSAIPMPPRKGRGPHKEETKEELLRRLLDPTLTLEETARLLDVCPTTVRRYTNRGILPHERSAGNQRRFKLSSVLAFREDQQRSKSAADPSEEE